MLSSDWLMCRYHRHHFRIWGFSVKNFPQYVFDYVKWWKKVSVNTSDQFTLNATQDSAQSVQKDKRKHVDWQKQQWDICKMWTQATLCLIFAYHSQSLILRLIMENSLWSVNTWHVTWRVNTWFVPSFSATLNLIKYTALSLMSWWCDTVTLATVLVITLAKRSLDCLL